MLWFFGPFIKLHVGIFATYFDRKVNDSREKRETCTNFPSPPLPKSKIIVVFGEVNKTRHEKTTLVFKHIHSPQIGETWTNPHPLESKKTDWIITIEVLWNYLQPWIWPNFLQIFAGRGIHSIIRLTQPKGHEIKVKALIFLLNM